MSERISSERYAQFLLECAKAQKSIDLFDVICRISSFLGAEKVVYFHFPPFGTDSRRDPLTIAYSGFDADVARRYVALRLWRYSKAIRRALRTGQPFRGSDAPTTMESLPDNAPPKVRDTVAVIDKMLRPDLEVDFGVFGPQGRTGFYAYWFPEGTVPDTDQALLIQAIGATAHVRYCVLREKEGMSETADLSAREIRVLTLAAEGKGRKVIAHETGLPETTVRSVVRSACNKLGLDGEDMLLSVVKGISLGQIMRATKSSDFVILRSPEGQEIIHLPSADE